MNKISETQQKSIGLTENISTVLATCLYGIETEELFTPSVAFPGCYTLKRANHSKGNSCMFSFSDEDTIRITHEAKEKEDDIKKERLERWLQEAAATNPCDKTLLEWSTSRIVEAAIICLKADSGADRTILGALKGNPTYNMMAANEVRKRAEELDRRFHFKYFVTLTWKADVKHGNRLAAWRAFKKKLAYFLKKMQQHLHGGYLYVVESTANGFPHAHIVFYMNTLLDPQHAKYTEAQTIHQGAFFALVEKYKTAPVFEVQAAADASTVHYLVKYITKYSQKDMLNPPDKKDKEKYKTWRKDMLTGFFTQVLGIRTWNSSRYKKIPLLPEIAAKERNLAARNEYAASKAVKIEYEGAYKPDWNVLMTVVSDEFKLKRQARAWTAFLCRLGDPNAHSLRRAALDWLLNNLPHKCKCLTRVGGGKRAHEVLDKYMDGQERVEEQVLREIEAHTVPVGCQDCIIKRLLRRRAGEDVSLIVKPKDASAKTVESRVELSPSTMSAEEKRRMLSRAAREEMQMQFEKVGGAAVFKNRYSHIENWTNAVEKDARKVFDTIEEQYNARLVKEQAIKWAQMGTPENPPVPFTTAPAEYMICAVLPVGGKNSGKTAKMWVQINADNMQQALTEWGTVEKWEDATVWTNYERVKEWITKAAARYSDFVSFESYLRNRHDVLVVGKMAGEC